MRDAKGAQKGARLDRVFGEVSITARVGFILQSGTDCAQVKSIGQGQTAHFAPGFAKSPSSQTVVSLLGGVS